MPGEVDVPAGAASLAKGLRLLGIVADSREPLRFSELQRKSGLPKPTFARILRTLIAFGLVLPDRARGTYGLGPRFLELSHRVWDKFDLELAASPELDRLSESLGETAVLCRLDGDRLQFLDQRSGDGLGVRIDTSRRASLHSNAAGKALLAFQDPAYSRAALSRIELNRHTGRTICDPQTLQADLALARARGYAVATEEHLEGVNCVAVPILGQDGFPIGALAVLAPSFRMDESSIHPVGRELIAAARRITGSSGAIAISSGPRPRSRGSRNRYNLECVLPWGSQLGEAPVWHAAQGVLYWVDILQPAVHRFDPATNRNDTRRLSKLVSAVLPTEGQSLVVATQDGIEELDFESGSLSAFVNPERDLTGNRLNDAKVGPGGAIWVGSMRMDASRPSGGLYRVTGRGCVSRMESGITVSNGLAWSPDEQTFYFVDTVPGRIYAYDCVPGKGILRNRRILATISEQDGRPDGLTVDRSGGIWCALWDGWRVNRYLPDGTLDHVIDLPVPRPTSVAFGGADLSTLYITSARTRLPATTLSEAPLSGGLFACKPGQSGIEPRLFPLTGLSSGETEGVSGLASE